MRQQRQMDEHGPFRSQLVGFLADRFEKRQTLDIADGAADLAQDEILVCDLVCNELFYRIGDVRNDLYRCAEVIAAPFAGDHGRIDAPCRDVFAFPGRDAGKAFVMAKVQIGFRPVVVT